MNIPEDHTAVVTFKKTIQPKQYESEAVEVTTALNDGDDIESSLDMIREMAYRHLGRSGDFTSYAQTAPAGAQAPKAEEAKPRRKRRTKAEIEADKAAEEAKQLAAMTEDPDNETALAKPPAEEKIVIEEEASVDEVSGEPYPSVQELAKYATAAAASEGVSAKDVNTLLKDRFGVSMLGKIKEEDRAEAIDLLKAITG